MPQAAQDPWKVVSETPIAAPPTGGGRGGVSQAAPSDPWAIVSESPIQAQAAAPGILSRMGTAVGKMFAGPGTLQGGAGIPAAPSGAPTQEEWQAISSMPAGADRDAKLADVTARQKAANAQLVENYRPSQQPLVDLSAAVPSGHPFVTGVAQAASGLSSFDNLMVMAGTSGLGQLARTPMGAQLASRLLSGGFTAQMIKGLYDQGGDFKAAIDAKDYDRAWQVAGQMSVTGVMTVAGARHALGGTLEAPVKAPPARQEAPGQTQTEVVTPPTRVALENAKSPGKPLVATEARSEPTPVQTPTQAPTMSEAMQRAQAQNEVLKARLATNEGSFAARDIARRMISRNNAVLRGEEWKPVQATPVAPTQEAAAPTPAPVQATKAPTTLEQLNDRLENWQGPRWTPEYKELHNRRADLLKKEYDRIEREGAGPTPATTPRPQPVATEADRTPVRVQTPQPVQAPPEPVKATPTKTPYDDLSQAIFRITKSEPGSGRDVGYKKALATVLGKHVVNLSQDDRVALAAKFDKDAANAKALMEDAQRVVANREFVRGIRQSISTMEPKYELVNLKNAEGKIAEEPSPVRAGFQGVGATRRQTWHELLGDQQQVNTALNEKGERVPVQSMISSARAISKLGPEEMQARDAEYTGRIESIKNEVRAQGGRPTEDQLMLMDTLIEAREAATGVRRVYSGKSNVAGAVGTESRGFWNRFYGKSEGYKSPTGNRNTVIPGGLNDPKVVARMAQLDRGIKLSEFTARALRGEVQPKVSPPVKVEPVRASEIKTPPAPPKQPVKTVAPVAKETMSAEEAAALGIEHETPEYTVLPGAQTPPKAKAASTARPWMNIENITPEMAMRAREIIMESRGTGATTDKISALKQAYEEATAPKPKAVAQAIPPPPPAGKGKFQMKTFDAEGNFTGYKEVASPTPIGKPVFDEPLTQAEILEKEANRRLGRAGYFKRVKEDESGVLRISGRLSGETLTDKATKLGYDAWKVSEKRPSTGQGWLSPTGSHFLKLEGDVDHASLANSVLGLAEGENGAAQLIAAGWIRKAAPNTFHVGEPTFEALHAIEKNIQLSGSGGANPRFADGLYLDTNYGVVGIDRRDFAENGFVEAARTELRRHGIRLSESGAVPMPQALVNIGNELAELGNRWKTPVGEFTKWVINHISPTTLADRDVRDNLMTMKGNMEYERFIAARIMKTYRDGFARMNDTDRLDVIHRIMTGTNLDTPELRAYAEAHRTIDDKVWNDVNRALQTRAGDFSENRLNYLDNHYRVLWKVKPGGTDEGYKAWLGKRPWAGSGGMLRERTYSDILDGMKEGGVPVTTNPAEMAMLGWADAQRFVHATTEFSRARDAGDIQFVKKGQRPNPGFVKVDDPKMQVYFPAASGEGLVHGGTWYAREDWGRMMNNYLSKDYVMNNAIGRGAMNWKNTSTGIRLWGSFHMFSMIGKSTAMDLLRGPQRIWNQGLRQGDGAAAIRGLKEMLKSPLAPYQVWKTGRAMQEAAPFYADMAKFMESPHGKFLTQEFGANAPDLLRDAAIGGLKLDVDPTYKIRGIDAIRNRLAKIEPLYQQGKHIQGMYHFGVAGAQVAAEPFLYPMEKMFNDYIPALKLGAFARQMDQMLEERGEDLANGAVTRAELARMVASHVDNVEGEFNADNLWQKRTAKSALQLIYNSPFWRAGTAKEFVEGAAGQAKEIYRGVAERKVPYLNPKAGYWLAEGAVMVTVGALFHRYMTGRNPQTMTDLTHPSTGVVDQRGKDVRMNLPLYSSRDLPELLTQPLQYMTGGMSSPVQAIQEFRANKKFSGEMIYDPQDTGVSKFLKGTANAFPSIISVASYQRLKQSGAPGSLAALGLSPARYDMDMSDAEKTASALSRRSSIPKTSEEMTKYTTKDHILALMRNNSPEADKAMDDAEDAGIIKPHERRELRESLKQTYLQHTVSQPGFSLNDALSVYEKATVDEKSDLYRIILQKARSIRNMSPEDQERLNKRMDEVFK